MRKNNLHTLVIIFYIILILPAIFALSDLNEKCYVKSVNKYGVCVNKNNCKVTKGQKGSAKSYKNLCKGSSNIQCCIKTVNTLKNGTKLSSVGTCKNVNDCPTTSNTLYSGECPGSNDVKLCVAKSEISDSSITPSDNINEECYVKTENKYGICKYTTQCIGNYKSVSVYCSNPSTDIQCCIPKYDTHVVNFIETISPLVISEASRREKWVLPSVCIAQAALETGWGESKLMTKANAYFGIKAGSNWKGKVYSASTQECYDGVNYTTIKDTFRAYDSLEDSIKDYYDLITNNDRYSKACNVKDAKTCITEIKNGGYATDPNYVSSIMSIITKYELTRYDSNIINSDNNNNTNSNAYDQKCNYNGIDGICMNENLCDTTTNVIISNLCPNLPNNVKCCVPKSIKTNSGLVQYAIKQKGKPYWYGTFGQIGTQSLYEQKKKQYPDYYTAKDFKDQIKQKVKVHDCVGLIKGYIWSETPDSTPTYNGSQDVSASGMYNISTEKGTSESFKKIIGQLVYKVKSNGVINHVGIYIGNNKVVEAKGHAYGVIESDYDNSWKYWSQCPYIKNDTTETNNTDSNSDNTKINVISTNGRCGSNYGKCPSNKCCSKKGYCGTSDSYCSKQKGCQSEYGKCKK